MKSRRTSGEIINATLLEIFLAFIFVVLTIAWLRTDQLEAEQAKNRGASARVDSLAAAVARLSAQAATAAHERDSIAALYRSQFRPICADPYLLTVDLLSTSSWQVTVHQTEADLVAGSSFVISPRDFPGRMAQVARVQNERTCYFRVITRDSPELDKTAYRHAVSQVRQIFYVAER
jgi:hypothetical protein